MNNEPQRELITSFTMFPSPTALEKIEHADLSWPEFVASVIDAPEYPKKEQCPLISMAEYGDVRTANGCLRHGGNVIRIFGVEVDYDAAPDSRGNCLSISEAAARLQKARITAVLHTSGRHTAEKPRWRALLPLAEPALPEQKGRFLARVNSILCGLIATESADISRSYFIGRVKGVPYETAETTGRCIDEAIDLEELPLRATTPGAGAARTGNYKPTTDEQYLQAFADGAGRYEAMLKMSSRWAARGLPQDDIESNLHDAFDRLGDGSSTNADGVDLRTRIKPLAESAVRKFGDPRAQPIWVPVDDEIPPDGDAPAWLEYVNNTSAPDEHVEASHIETCLAQMRADLDAPADAVDRAQPPAPIVEGLLFACGSNLAAAGGTGKSTLALCEAVHIVGGGRLYGCEVIKQRPCVFVVAEDGVDYSRYMLGRVLADAVAQGAISERLASMAKAGIRFIGWPREKFGPIAVVGRDGSATPAPIFEALGELLQPIDPARVTLDPLSLLTPNEDAGNSVDAIVSSTIHRLAQTLGAHVEAIDHVAKAVARGGIIDQFAARGSSAKTDNARMARVLTRIAAGDSPPEMPPALQPETIAAGDALRLDCTKLNYARRPPTVWLRRRGHWFDALPSVRAEDAAIARADEERRRLDADVDCLAQTVRDQRARGEYPTTRTLEDFGVLAPDGQRMARARLRTAITRATSNRALREAALPDHLRVGQRRTYLEVVTP